MQEGIYRTRAGRIIVRRHAGAKRPLPSRGRSPVSGRRQWPGSLAEDQAQREQAARIGEVFPHWLVMWGAHSREYWAYPRFGAPKGTMAHSADPSDLAATMRKMQTATTEWPR